MPTIDIEDEVKAGKLINLLPKKIWQEPIYWHYFTIQSPAYQGFMKTLMDEIKNVLKP